MRLFNKTIDRQLFKQYSLGSDLSKQEVVAKIFNPMGAGTWFILNSDPQDPDYLWAIVDLGYGAEVGSVSRTDLETYRGRFGMGFERDLSFDPVNALELYNGLSEGKFYAKGGGVDSSEENTFDKIFLHYGFTKKRGAYGVRPYEHKKLGTYAQIDDKTRSVEIETPDDEYKGGYSVKGVIEFLKSKGFEETGSYADGGEIEVVYERRADFKKKPIRLLLLNKGKEQKGYTFSGKDQVAVLDNYNRNKQEDLEKLWNLKGYETKYADGGSVKVGYNVFNYTDNIYATDEVFKTKALANKFIKEFRSRFSNQGYYRDNRMNKINIQDIDLLAIPSDFNPFKKYADGGLIQITKNSLPKEEVLYNFKKIGLDGKVQKESVGFVYYNKNLGGVPVFVNNKNDDFDYQELQKTGFTHYKKEFADGGELVDYSDNQRMVMNQNVEVEHHHEELEDILEDKVPVPAWVVAKMETATQNLSDITHYLDGQKELMEDEMEDENEEEDEDQDEIENKIVVEPIDVSAGTKTDLTKKFTDDAMGNLRGFLKGMEGVDLRDDYTFDYKDEQYEVEPIINSDENGVSNAVFTIFDGDGEEVGDVAYSRDGGKQKFTANSEFFSWNNAKFEDGGYFDGAIPKASSYMSTYAKGGEIAKGEILGLKRNFMGTTDVEIKISGMRKPQRFSVYPIGKDDSGDIITIQSETRIGKIDLSSGRGLMSQSHSNGAYFVHFQMDKLTPFTISESDLEDLKMHIFKTAGDNVGSRGIVSDNSGASRLFANGGATTLSGYPKEDIEEKFRSKANITWKHRKPDNWKTYYDIWDELTPAGRLSFLNWIINNLQEKGIYISKEEADKISKINYRDVDVSSLSKPQVIVWITFMSYAYSKADIKKWNSKKLEDGGFMADVYAKGGGVDDYISMKRLLSEFKNEKEIFDGQIVNRGTNDFKIENDNFYIKRPNENWKIFRKIKYADGGETEKGVDLFEDYENIPDDLQEILDNYQDAFEDGDYQGLEKALKEANAIGYTFEYYLDGQAYDLRKIGQKGKSEVEEYAKGGNIKKYILKADIKTVTVKRKGKEVTFKGADVLNGAHVLAKGGDITSKANYVGKNDVVEVELKDGSKVKPANGYWIKKGAEPIASKQEFTSKDLPKDGSEIKITAPKLGNFPEIDLILKYDSKNFRFDVYKDGVKKDVIGEKEVLNNLNSGIYMLSNKSTPTASGKSETKFGETYIKKDMRNNWKAETTLDDFNDYDWKISTIKTYSGNLVSSAQGGKTEPTGSKGIQMWKYTMYQDPNYTLEVSKPSRLTDKVVSEQHEKALAKFKKFMETGMFKGGGKISNFDKLSAKVAKEYEGKPVKSQYQEEYGKYYSKEEAQEVGDKVAGKVKAMQPAKKEMGGETKKRSGSEMLKQANILAKKIRKDGESWNDAKKRAFAQLKK